MIDTADQMKAGTILEADICIAGAGPAGITLALNLAAAGFKILLFESGGLRPDAASQALCAGEVCAGSVHPPADRYRRRALGGSSAIWGGRCAPLDPIDFASRPWLNLPSGWPISYESMLPYWRRAHAWADLGRYDYDAKTAVPAGMRPMLPDFAAASISTDRIERFSRPVNFGASYSAELARHRNIQVVLHATCTNIDLAGCLTAVRQIDLRTRAGNRLHGRGRAYVLAGGGLEIPRLLLASNTQTPAGIGNDNDKVGRYYMSHLAATVGSFTPTPGKTPYHGYERDEGGVYCRRRIAVEDWAQQAHRIGNVIARLHHPPPGNSAHRSGPLSAVHLGRRLLQPEYALPLSRGTDHDGAWHHTRNIAADPWNTTRFAFLCLSRRLLPARKYPSVVVTPPNGVFTLDVHAEQLPNAESRITLARRTDRFGVRLPRIAWRHMPDDIRAVRVTLALISEALVMGGHGTLACDDDEVGTRLLEAGAYGGHHLGTARMSDTRFTGVVDRDCRVHGLNNLYIASGAVFPTSGQANPTLTILALTLRLADFLASRLNASTSLPHRVLASAIT